MTPAYSFPVLPVLYNVSQCLPNQRARNAPINPPTIPPVTPRVTASSVDYCLALAAMTILCARLHSSEF